MHQAERPTEAARGQVGLEVGDVAVDQRLHVGVGAGGHRARIFAQLGDDLAGKRYRQIRKLAPDELARGPLVRGIGIGMQKAQRERIDALVY